MFRTFIEDVLNGKATADDIDDYVTRWHDGDSVLPLHEFLGLSEQEYFMWVTTADVLLYLIEAHRLKMKVQEVEDMEMMEPNNVYVIPYNKEIVVTNGHIKLIPDVLIGGTNSNGTAMDGLLGLKLMEMMDPKNKKEDDK